MQAPTTRELLNHPVVQQALEEAWLDSVPADPVRRHEEGGWIYADLVTGDLSVRRAPMGGQAVLDLSAPPFVSGAVVVATFHTNPNPAAEGWDPGPSAADSRCARIAGVPFLVRAEDGVHTTGPRARRGGLAGGPGYPR